MQSTLEPNSDSLLARKLAIGLILLGLIGYMNLFVGVFVFDDNGNIVDNPKVRKLPGFDELRPRFVIFFLDALQYQIDGLNIRLFHLVNLVIHLANGLLLFSILRQVLNTPRISESVKASATLISAGIAALWLLHPLQTQAVTYTIQRCESLMVTGAFIVIRAWIELARATRYRWAWMLLIVLAGWIGLGSKETIVVLPMVLLFFDRAFLSAGWKEVLVKRGWAHLLFAISQIGLFIPMAGRVVTGGAGEAALGFDLQSITPKEYLFTQSHVLFRYLQLCFWPVDQTFDYFGYPLVRSLNDAIVPGLFWVGLVIISFVGACRGNPFCFVGISCFLVLAPTSSIMPIQDVCVEHRMYMPLAGVLILSVFAGRWLLNRLGAIFDWPPDTIDRGGRTWLLVLLFPMMLMTLTRNETYASPALLWQDTANKRPTNYRAQALLFTNTYSTPNEKSEKLLLDALSLNPNYEDAIINLAVFRMDQGRMEEAVALAKRANEMVLRPDVDRSYALILMVAKKSAEAIPFLLRSAQKRTTDGLLQILLGLAYHETGDEASSQAAYQVALQIEPGIMPVVIAQCRRSLFCEITNPSTLRQSRMYAEIGVALTQGKDPEALELLSLIQAKEKQFPQAVQSLKQAITLLDPEKSPRTLRRLQRRLQLFEKSQPLEQSTL
jgi:protein O-mannosyl-transferase